MFARVTIRASDVEASKRFYATVLATLGGPPGDFAIAEADEGRAVTRGLHLGFAAPSRAHAEAFHRAGVEAGYRDDGAPGPRPEYGDDYFGAFLLDPDGNSAEAVVHDDLRPGIDHIWFRVADRAASRAFYAAIAERTGFREVADLPDRTRYSPGRGRGSFSIVDGSPTAPFGLAFAGRGGGAVPAARDPDGHDVEVIDHGT